jgi:hypothetical protein
MLGWDVPPDDEGPDGLDSDDEDVIADSINMKQRLFIEARHLEDLRLTNFILSHKTTEVLTDLITRLEQTEVNHISKNHQQKMAGFRLGWEELLALSNTEIRGVQQQVNHAIDSVTSEVDLTHTVLGVVNKNAELRLKVNDLSQAVNQQVMDKMHEAAR